jgi:thymidylate synthase
VNLVSDFYGPGEAWNYAKGIIHTYGNKVVTEDNQLCKEIENLKLTVNNPGFGWPIGGSGWTLDGLKSYGKQFLDYNRNGFDYTYGNRMRKFFQASSGYELHNDGCIDQIEECCAALKGQPNTRRAIIVLWSPDHDLNMPDSHPCMISVNFLVRDSKLNVTAYFRSHDIEQAWPQNVYGLWKLQEYVAKDIKVEIGTVTTFSVNAHIYLDGGKKVWKI